MSKITEVAPTSKRFNEKREALLAAASRLFNEKGFVATTLAEVAASVGLIKNSVTYYYRRKEDLTVACLMRAMAVHEDIIARAAKESSVSERVMQLIRLQVELQGQILDGLHPPIVSFYELRALDQPHAGEVFSAYTAMYRRLRELLRHPDTNDWPRAHLNARAHLLISVAIGMRPLVARYEPEDRMRMAQRYGDIVLNGIGATESSWSSSGLEADWLARVPEADANSLFLKAATELINEQGYGGASVNRIAERLNFTKGAFYYYNDNKDDLVAQCFERSVATIRKAVNLTESYEVPAWEHLCSVARGLVRFQLSDDGPLLRSTANSALPDIKHRERVNAELGRVIERVAGVVVSGLMDGSVRRVDPKLAAVTVLTGIMAAAELCRWVDSADELNAADLFARPLLMGLLCAPTS